MSQNKKSLRRLYQKNQDETKRLLKNLVLRLEESDTSAKGGGLMSRVAPRASYASVISGE
jgi:hypothetical protein